MMSARNLISIKEDVTSSKYCKNSCIDEKYNFCPTNTKFSKGTCCTDAVCKGKVDICSKEITDLSEMMYQACPKEAWCGDYFVTPENDGVMLEIKPTEEASNDNLFSQGALCTYQINFPENSGDKDRLQVSLESKYKADVMFIASTSFAAKDRQSASMYISANMSIGYPYKVYLTAVSTGQEVDEVGDFRFNVRYEKYDPNKTEDSGSGGSNVIVVKNNTFTTQYVEQDLWESEDFLMIVYIAGGALALIIILICCLVCLKIRGDKLTQVKTIQTNNSPVKSIKGSPGPASKPVFDESGDGAEMEFVQSNNMFKSVEEQ
jgi:hypothetical protein